MPEQETRIYFDTNIIVYLLEGESALRELAAQAIVRFADEAHVLVSSELALAECLHGAYRQNRLRTADAYRKLLLDSGDFMTVSLSLNIFELGAKIAAQHRMKLLDALHLACALHSGCTVFLTNDKRLHAFDGLEVRGL